MNKLSKRINNLSESATLAMSRLSRELKQQGKDVISLSLGEPDFNTPDFIKNSAVQAINDNFSHYTPVPGILELRKSICKKFYRDNNLEFNENQIVVSTGAKQSIANVCLSLLDKEDEVILLAPYWVSYFEIVKLCGAKPIVVESKIEKNFKSSVEEIENKISNKTKLLIFSSPCNPSGSVYSKKELVLIANMLNKYDNLFFSPSLRTVHEKLETNSLASTSIKKQEGNYFTSQVGYSFDYDVRNQRFQTTSGFRSRFSQTLPIISESDTLTTGYIYDQYLSYEELTTSIGLYLKNTVGLSDDVRISERLSIPRKRLRGFKPGRIGPVDQGDDHVGGNYAAAISVTTNLPMIAPTLQNFEFNYFVDFGNVWGADYRSSNFDDSNFLRVSTGAGIEWWTPVGPLNLTFSHALQKKTTDEFEGFQFNIGTTF